MEGQKVFKHAIVKMPEVVREVLGKTGLTHRATSRSSSRTRPTCASPRWCSGRSELRDDQVFNNIQKYGNTTAASHPARASPRPSRRAA